MPSPRRLLPLAATLGLAAALLPVTDAEAARKKNSAPAYELSGTITSVSQVVINCPAIGGGRTRETARWTTTYTVNGAGRAGSGGAIKYSQTRKLFKQTEVWDNEYIRPYTYDGPEEKWGSKSIPWGTFATVKKNGRVALDLSAFTSIKQTIDTAGVRKGKSKPIPLDTKVTAPKTADSPKCTSTDETQVTGSLTLTRTG